MSRKTALFVDLLTLMGIILSSFVIGRMYRQMEEDDVLKKSSAYNAFCLEQIGYNFNLFRSCFPNMENVEDATNNNGYNALMLAIRYGKTAIREAELIVADPRFELTKHYNGKTPLEWASYLGNVDFLELDMLQARLGTRDEMPLFMTNNPLIQHGMLLQAQFRLNKVHALRIEKNWPQSSFRQLRYNVIYS
jgi:hypothetical protein